MSPYRLTNICTFTLLSLIVLTDFFVFISGYLYLFIGIIYVMVLGLGAASMGLNFYTRSMHKGRTREKLVALTYDDGPDQGVSPQLLQLLSMQNISATFFCIGHKIKAHPTIVKELSDAGHLIGNHSYSHAAVFDLYTPKRMTDELIQTNEIIEQTIGRKPRLFRPPYGVTNPMLAKAIKNTGMQPVGWSLRSFDTMHEASRVLAKITNSVKPGDIILLHDNNNKCLEITSELLKWFHKNEYKVVSLEQLLNIKAYA